MFVGRLKELAQLRACVADALSGRGRLVLLVGEPGIGKTTLAHEVASHARRTGLHVSWGRCDDIQGAPPFWPWLQVIRSLTDAAGAADAAQAMSSIAAGLSECIPAAEPASDPRLPPGIDGDRARFQFFDAVARFLRDASAQQPLLLALDDLHVADGSSLLLLQFLAPRLAEMPVMVLAGYRDAEVGIRDLSSSVVAELVREPTTVRIALGGLCERDIGRYIELATGTTPAASVVGMVASRTEGNPFFISEIVRLLVSDRLLEGGALRDAPAILPKGIREAIALRLKRLSPRCNRTLAQASVLGHEFSLDVLARTGDVSRADLLADLREAIGAGVVTEGVRATSRYGFRHGLLRDALYRALGASDRIDLHRRAGEALEKAYPARIEEHLTELAHHFLEAAEVDGRDKALHYALRAGDRARDQMAHEDAARDYGVALHLLDRADDGCRFVDVSLSRSDALWRAGDVAAAKDAALRACDVARRLQDPDRFARAALAFAGRLPVFGAVERDTTVTSLLDEALLLLGDRHLALEALLRARWAEEETLAPAHERRWELSRQAVEIARRVGEPIVLASVLKCTYFAHWDPEDLAGRLAVSEEIIRLAEEARDRTLTLEGHVFRLLSLIEAGDRSGADREFDHCERTAGDLRQPYYHLVIAALRGCLAFFEGRLGDVDAHTRQVMSLGEAAGTQNGLLFAGGQLAGLMWLQGRFGELEQMITGFGGAYPFLASHYRAALAATYAEDGRREEARRQFEECAINDFRDVPRHVSWQADVAFLAEACAVLKDRQRAEHLYETLRPLDGRNLILALELPVGPAAYFLGILASTMDRWPLAASHFEAALELADRNGAIHHRARTAVAYADMLVRRALPGDIQHARSLLSDAIVVANDLGMTRLAERAREIERLVAPSHSPPEIGVPAQERSAESPTQDAAAAMSETDTVVFRREGEYWTIAHQAAVVRLKDAKGLRYLALLLRHPGREFHVLDLASAGHGERAIESPTRCGERALDLPGSGALLDATAKRSYRDRLAELREELEDAERCNDLARADAARSETELLTEQLASAFGLRRRDRSVGSSAERARSAVTKGIKAMVAKIAAADAPLGRHLAGCVRTGYICSYRPDPDRRLRWIF